MDKQPSAWLASQRSYYSCLTRPDESRPPSRALFRDLLISNDNAQLSIREPSDTTLEAKKHVDDGQNEKLQLKLALYLTVRHVAFFSL